MKRLAAALVVFILGGCATAYQSVGQTGGFYHQKVAEDAYIIGFQGNGFTASKRANDFARLRAAEIGQKLGYTHFVVEGTLDKSQTDIVNTGSTTTTSGNIYGYGNSASFSGTSTTQNRSMPIYKPGVEIGVLYFEGEPSGRHLDVFVIEDVIDELRAEYEIVP